MSENKTTGMTRRDFLVKAALGSGVIMSVGVVGCGPLRKGLANFANEAELDYNNKVGPMAWFEITAENQVILHSPKVEMGQGVFTGMAQLAAEELEVDMGRIQVVNAISAGHPVDPFSTGGSTTISGLWEPLRELAAQMREMLKSSAADLMGTDSGSLSVKDGVISGGGQNMTYGEVVQKTTKWPKPKKKIPLKDPKNYKFIGKAIPRIDLKAKVMGDPIFGIDTVMPDMLYGAVVRSQQVAATFAGADVSAAVGMPGVIKVVVEDDFVGVVARSHVEADQAKKAIKANWTTEKNWELSDVRAMIKVGAGKDFEIQKEGNPKKAFKEGDVITAEYTSPIGAHAHIEPNGAVAHVTGDKCVLKISTQVVKITRSEVAKRLGMKEDQVEVQATYVGGGFGRRLHTPNAIQAAVMSKAVGKPVHVFFDRREEFQNDTFRPPTHHVLKGKLDENGRIEAIEHNVSSGDVAFGSPLIPRGLEAIAGADFGAWRGGMIQYAGIPNYRAVSWRVKLPFATSWWRSLGLLANTFAIESFVDEMCLKAGKDPVQFRLDHCSDDERGKRLHGVIKAAAEKGNWGRSMPADHAQGFAASTDANVPVAHVVEVSVTGKKIKVHKVVCAIDPGVVVNPDGVRAQCEGAIIMGMSACLFEKMEIKNGAIVPTNYGSYPMALMKDAPKEIDVVLLENGEKPRGVGEPPMGPIGAAIANAVYRITKQRLRDLPLSLA